MGDGAVAAGHNKSSCYCTVADFGCVSQSKLRDADFRCVSHLKLRDGHRKWATVQKQVAKMWRAATGPSPNLDMSLGNGAAILYAEKNEHG